MVPCPVCRQAVDWVTVPAASKVLGVSEGRVRQFITQGRIPGAEKTHPDGGIQPFWALPIASVLALKEARG